MELLTRNSLFGILVALLECAWTSTTLGVSTYQITFFMHDDLLTVNNPSAFVLTRHVGPGYFGTLVAFDEILTSTPDPNSFSFGRGRGLYLFDANDNLGPGRQFVWTAYFPPIFLETIDPTTITFAGFERTNYQTREISIVGGTGFFRSAQGYAVIGTYSRTGFATVLNITTYVTYPDPGSS